MKWVSGLVVQVPPTFLGLGYHFLDIGVLLRSCSFTKKLFVIIITETSVKKLMGNRVKKLQSKTLPRNDLQCSYFLKILTIMIRSVLLQ